MTRPRSSSASEGTPTTTASVIREWRKEQELLFPSYDINDLRAGNVIRVDDTLAVYVQFMLFSSNQLKIKALTGWKDSNMVTEGVGQEECVKELTLAKSELVTDAVFMRHWLPSVAYPLQMMHRLRRLVLM